MITRPKQTLIYLFICVLYFPVSGNSSKNFKSNEKLSSTIPAPESIFDKLSNGNVLEMTLETDLTFLIDNKNTDDYIPAQITYKNSSGLAINRQLKVKPRGKFRRRVCDVPPLKLKFKKEDLAKENMKSFNKLKLVTHCLDEKGLSKELILKEYLAYKLYNELTPYSFRVQLVKITYQDSGNEGRKMKRWGFLIESTSQVEERLNGVECENSMGLPESDFHAGAENIQSMFQYMIGNSDWSLSMARNVKLIKLEKNQKVVPVPYDFDFSGLVGAPYAIPAPSLNLTNSKERVFLGNADSIPELNATESFFKTKKKGLMKTVNKFKWLSADSKIEIMEYLESFFDEMKRSEIRFAEIAF